MRFFDQQPYGYSGHSTGSEHAVKNQYDPVEINALRLQDNPSLDPWDIDEVRNVMSGTGEDGELVNAYYQVNGNLIMAGGALVHYAYPEDGKIIRALVDGSDILVAPEHRGKGLGKYLFSKSLVTLTRGYGDTPYPSEAVVTDRNGIIGPNSRVALAKAGFSRQDEDGHPKMLLAGFDHGERGFENGEAYREFTSQIPKDWNGFLTVEESPIVNRPTGQHVFRNGQFIGTVEKVADKVFYDLEDRPYINYNYYDSVGRLVAINVRQPTNPFFAVSDLVNRLI